MCCFYYKKLLQRGWMVLKPFFPKNNLPCVSRKLVATFGEKQAGMIRSRGKKKQKSPLIIELGAG
jgi:hypothetical protein